MKVGPVSGALQGRYLERNSVIIVLKKKKKKCEF